MIEFRDENLLMRLDTAQCRHIYKSSDDAADRLVVGVIGKETRQIIGVAIFRLDPAFDQLAGLEHCPQIRLKVGERKAAGQIGQRPPRPVRRGAIAALDRG